MLALGCNYSSAPEAAEAPTVEREETSFLASGEMPAPAETQAAVVAETPTARGQVMDDGTAQVADLLARAESEPAAEAAFAGAPAGGASAMASGSYEGRAGYVAPRRTQARYGVAGTVGAAASGGSTVRARPAAPVALPQNGVLASTFVGGNGMRTRLEDLLDRGVMVGGEHVRLEAFAEREALPYPKPAREGMAMFAELERERLDVGRDRVHLQVALVGREGELPQRPHMDVRLVLDRSGSMHGEKWHHAVAAAHAIVDDLGPDDTFTLVSYSDDASVDFGPARRGNGQAAHQAIRRLAPGGGTNISAALERVGDGARRSANTLGVALLISDGQATIGQTSAQELGAIARRHFDATGMLTTAIGLGTDFDEQTMLSIAREGSGSYHFVRRPEDVQPILEDELRARAQAVAQALRVRVELGEGVVARRVYGSRLLSEAEHAAVRATEVATDARIARELGIATDRRNEDERGLRIHLPTFRRGDQHVILMELEVPAGTRDVEVAKVTLDYKDLARRSNETIVRQVRASRVDTERAHASVVRTVKRTVLAFQAGEALQRAAEALEVGDAELARREIEERRELLQTASSVWRDPALAADASLLARYERVLGGGVVDYGARQQLAMAMSYFGDRRMR
ncbi:MAG: VWA domain-containing protein [Sandaracinus sp.]|nr:VWA domain-containing protein [Myxococcales bacterium]MCB9601735.1 VWA domain-containing protein [Sandaracinus sp.]MCB9619013.1 VWA domain-containing protein [Sandaracinus sp.]MCB9624744.1 VWA domain-containing protein [Sandaracinus sp.]